MLGHEEAAADLRWLFTQSGGELGLRSNLAGLVARIEGGGGSYGAPEMDTRRIDAATRARAITKALVSIPQAFARVLFLAFAPSAETPEAHRLHYIAIETDECLEAYVRSRSTREVGEWFARLTAAARRGQDSERRRTWNRIQAQAQQTLEVALVAYCKAKGSVR